MKKNLLKIGEVVAKESRYRPIEEVRCEGNHTNESQNTPPPKGGGPIPADVSEPSRHIEEVDLSGVKRFSIWKVRSGANSAVLFERDGLQKLKSKHGEVHAVENVSDCAWSISGRNPKGVQQGLILVVKHDKDLYVVTTGCGHTKLKRQHFEAEFGGAGVGQICVPELLREVTVEQFGPKPLRRQTKSYKRRRIREIDPMLGVCVATRIRGGAAIELGVKEVEGCTSLRVVGDEGVLDSIQEILGVIKRALASPRTQLSTQMSVGARVSASLVCELEEHLKQEIIGGALRASSDLTIHWDPFPGNLRLTRRKKIETSLEGLGAAVESLCKDDEDLEKLWCQVEEDDGFSEKVRFLTLICGTMEYQGKRYIRINCNWFCLSAEWEKSISEGLKEFETTSLDIPEWDRSEHSKEADFNKYLSQEMNGKCLDKALEYTSLGKYEIADILLADGTLLHLKEGDSSAAINHLIGQLHSSAELLDNHLLKLRELGVMGPEAGRRLVALIGRKDPNEGMGMLLGAKINLLETCRQLRAKGFDVQVQYFQMA